MKKELTIGRSSESDILISDSSVSRKHASLLIRGIDVSVRDNDSLNGTYINGNKVHETTPIYKNDILKVGNSLVPWMKYVELNNNDIKTKIDKNIKKEITKTPKVEQNLELDNAKTAKICGILGIFFSLGMVGIVLNIIALYLANSAISKYEKEPLKYSNKSYKNAKSGQVLGGIGLSIFVIVFIIILGKN